MNLSIISYLLSLDDRLSTDYPSGMFAKLTPAREPLLRNLRPLKAAFLALLGSHAISAHADASVKLTPQFEEITHGTLKHTTALTELEKITKPAISDSLTTRSHPLQIPKIKTQPEIKTTHAGFFDPLKLGALAFVYALVGGLALGNWLDLRQEANKEKKKAEAKEKIRLAAQPQETQDWSLISEFMTIPPLDPVVLEAVARDLITKGKAEEALELLAKKDLTYPMRFFGNASIPVIAKYLDDQNKKDIKNKFVTPACERAFLSLAAIGSPQALDELSEWLGSKQFYEQDREVRLTLFKILVNHPQYYSHLCQAIDGYAFIIDRTLTLNRMAKRPEVYQDLLVYLFENAKSEDVRYGTVLALLPSHPERILENSTLANQPKSVQELIAKLTQKQDHAPELSAANS